MLGTEGNPYGLCIIGAGIIGSAAAKYACQQSQLKVCLIGPREPEVRLNGESNIFGAYYDVGRIQRSASHKHPVWSFLNSRTVQSYKTLEAETGISIFMNNGNLLVAKDGDEYIQGYSNCPNGQIQCLTASETMKQYPFLHVMPSDSSVLCTHDEGTVNPRNIVQAQQMAALSYGCHISYDIVDQLVYSSSDKKRLVKLVTAGRQELYTEKVLLATGAFTAFRDLLPHSLTPDVELWTQTVLLAEVSEQDAHRLKSMPCIDYNGNSYGIEKKDSERTGIYALPPLRYPNGKYYAKIGHGGQYDDIISTEEEVKHWYCNKPPEHIVSALKQWITAILPDVTFLSFSSDTCVTTNTPSRVPYIDMVSPVIGVALAGNGQGAMAGDEIGRLAADLVLNGTWRDRHLPWHLFRFQDKAKAKAKL